MPSAGAFVGVLLNPVMNRGDLSGGDFSFYLFGYCICVVAYLFVMMCLRVYVCFCVCADACIFACVRLQVFANMCTRLAWRLIEIFIEIYYTR